MNIHEYQAKKILKEFGAPVSDGIVIFDVNNLNEKIKDLNSEELVLKAQIHAGGRGKAGGVKLVKKIKILEEAKKLFGKTLVTPQTGPEGKEVKRIYIQKAYDISKELYLSCIIDRRSAKIAFISSTEGGVDIELVAKNNPEKIITTKIDFKKSKFSINLLSSLGSKPFKLSIRLSMPSFGSILITSWPSSSHAKIIALPDFRETSLSSELPPFNTPIFIL